MRTRRRSASTPGRPGYDRILARPMCGSASTRRPSSNTGRRWPSNGPIPRFDSTSALRTTRLTGCPKRSRRFRRSSASTPTTRPRCCCSATRELQRALAAAPNDFEANLQLGALLRRDERHEASILYLRRAVQLRPQDVTARFGLAGALLSLGNLDDSRALLEQVVADAPE